MPDKQVALLEDDELTRDRLCEKLNELEGFEVLFAVGSVAAVRQALAETQPDVLLVDLELPDGSGLDIIAEQHNLHPGLPMLVISVFGDEKSVVRAIR